MIDRDGDGAGLDEVVDVDVDVESVVELVELEDRGVRLGLVVDLVEDGDGVDLSDEAERPFAAELIREGGLVEDEAFVDLED